MAGQAAACAEVGAGKVRWNQAWMAGWKLERGAGVGNGEVAEEVRRAALPDTQAGA